MKTQSLKIVLALAGFSLITGCTPVEFKQIASEKVSEVVTPDPDVVVVVPTPTPAPTPAPTPVVVVPTPTPAPTPAPTPIVVVPTPTPVPPPPAPILGKGACAADSSTKLLSCMNCLVPVPPTPAPQLSKKGQALLDIMSTSCQVTNKSDPAGYVPPTRAELLRRLNKLSPTLYPDTAMTATQTSTINALLTNPAAVKEMFGGIWYSGVKPETVAFETYFGLETIEARYAFCYANSSNGTGEGSSVSFNRYNTTPLHSKAWVDCQYGNDPFNCKENAAYTSANGYRNQLRAAMNESINNPYVPPKPVAGTSCDWEKFDGLYDDRADAQIKAWLASGFTIGGEITSSTPAQNMCAMIKAPLAGVVGKITMGAYRCK